MEAAGKTQWYIGAPNGVVICVRAARHGQLSGELYHSYSDESVPFESLKQMTLAMERLYDWLQFPRRGTNSRSFTTAERPTAIQTERRKLVSDETLLSKHGDIGTFIVRVQHRQNSSWQGRITWMEEDRTIQFRSVWEMIKLMESAVDTVSAQESESASGEPTWFGVEEN